MASRAASALSYADPAVTAAAVAALERGVVGPLAPVDEEAVARVLGELIPWADSVRFLKTGAEAVAAAVGDWPGWRGNRDRVLGCGYHGWLDLARGYRGPACPGAVSGRSTGSAAVRRSGGEPRADPGLAGDDLAAGAGRAGGF